MKHALARLCALALLLALCAVPAAAAPQVPGPTSDFYAGDFAGVLSEQTREYIVDQNLALQQYGGAQIVVVTVDFLDGYDIADYAVTLFNDWEIGSEEYNNGYLILLAIGEDNYYSLPGKGLEETLDGGTIDALQQQYLEEYFAAGEYDAGVRAYFDAVLDVVQRSQPLTGVSGPEQPVRETSGGLGLFPVVMGLIVFIIALAVIFSLAGIRSVYRPVPRRGIFWWGMRPRAPRPPRPPRPPGPSGGMFFGGGGRTRGGGVSRRPGMSSRGSFGGFGGRSGGFRGGGGRTRGGGAGRRGR